MIVKEIYIEDQSMKIPEWSILDRFSHTYTAVSFSYSSNSLY